MPTRITTDVFGAAPRAGRIRIWIGTSGWSYDGWRGALYPEKLPKKDWLRYYGSQFPSAEINASFYRTPTLEAVRAWAATPLTISRLPGRPRNS
jgi:Protein of unknown function DUF72